MLCWGFGDFSIQKSTRKLGDWETLFVITSFGTVVLLPFVYRDLPKLFVESGDGLMVLISSGIFLTCASLLIFEGYKRGKIAVLEPLLAFEIPAASLLAFFVLGDRISWLQIFVIVILMVGLFMVSFREKKFTKSFFLEKGVIIFFVGAIVMGFGDFLLGWGSRITNPLLANFILNLVMVTISSVFILSQKKFGRMFRDIMANRSLMLVMSIADNVAWIAYAFAMSLVPIAIATGLSESSIIVAVILGLAISHEKLQRHQKIGLVIALTSAIILAVIT